MSPSSGTANKPEKLKTLSPPIHSLLSRLRSRIRAYVLFEGIAIAIIWLILMFWIALALDYLPVLFGFSELSQIARAIILGITAVLIGWVLYRFVLRRIFVRMQDRSMALLVERKYPQFNDSLLTTVSRTVEHPVDVSVDQNMLERTRIDAESFVRDVDPASVINSKPLKRSAFIAGLLLLSVGGLAIANPGAIKLAGQRIYLLDKSVWPRSCQLEMIGIKIKRENPVEGIDELGQIVKPVDGKFKIAKGSTLTLMVRAEGGDESSRRLPGNCSLIYRTSDGDRGRQAFKKIGGPRGGYQLYSLDQQPLRGILTDISFDIRGGDHRLGPFEIEVVDEPDIFSTQLACKFPQYLVDESSLRWTDRTIEWSGQSRLPQGTKVTIQATANKPITKVYAHDRAANKMTSVPASGNEFEYELPPISDAVNLQFYLCDLDGLVSEEPYTISINSIEDQPPTIRTQLKGIGTAVTPDVQIPFSGTIEDDYGLKRTWVEIEVAETETISEPLTVDSDGKLETVLDFKQRKQKHGDQYDLPTGDDNTVALVVKSQDKFDLNESENLGIGDRYVLDIVNANQLVRILERLEVGQRRRLEQIYLETADTRNYLLRSKSKRSEYASELVEPGDNSEPGDEDSEQPEARKQEMRLLFAQRAIIQIDKSTQEILGSAEAFDNIRLQLINNRIDSEDRKKRFSEQIIGPLRLIGNESMQQLKKRTTELESGLRDLQISPNDQQVSGAADELSTKAIEKTDEVLKQLDEVLNVLIKYETQNELLEIVRRMIKEQQELMERTKKERQKKAFEGLLD